MSRTAVHAFGSPFSKFSPGRFCPVQQSTDASIQPRPALYGGSGTLLACGHDGSVSLSLSLTFHILYLFELWDPLGLWVHFNYQFHLNCEFHLNYLKFSHFAFVCEFHLLDYVRPRYTHTRTHIQTHSPLHTRKIIIRCYIPHAVSTVGGGLRWGQDGRCLI